jgi:hypothetical protein
MVASGQNEQIVDHMNAVHLRPFRPNGAFCHHFYPSQSTVISMRPSCIHLRRQKYCHIKMAQQSNSPIATIAAVVGAFALILVAMMYETLSPVPFSSQWIESVSTGERVNDSVSGELLCNSAEMRSVH